MKITFYKSAKNYKGDTYKSPLGSFEFNGAITENDAIQRAQNMFAERMKISRWNEIAEFFEIQ